MLAKQVLYYLNQSCPPFLCWLLLRYNLALCPGCLDHDPPICASCIAGMIGMHHHAQPLVKIGSHELFCLGWA
jgi:hypothetical protein